MGDRDTQTRTNLRGALVAGWTEYVQILEGWGDLGSPLDVGGSQDRVAGTQVHDVDLRSKETEPGRRLPQSRKHPVVAGEGTEVHVGHEVPTVNRVVGPITTAAGGSQTACPRTKH